MRVFQDRNGDSWVASVGERDGDDYKGRYVFRMSPQSGAHRGSVTLTEVRWNSPETAENTLRTMSGEELRRRLRSALGRNVKYR